MGCSSIDSEFFFVFLFILNILKFIADSNSCTTDNVDAYCASISLLLDKFINICEKFASLRSSN
ncbi:hypothetical protein [Vaccinia virus]|nr:hypothetical protein [Vaccinia virus]